MPITPKEMVRLLKKNGFSQSGSHLKLINHETGCRTLYQFMAKI
ncbi:type II toxin-antitoxin system HicA family toxin [Thomasclavelia cocleata]|jgi:predicted RNA binding protein YcfA (HicA-like mRNA interferase family)|nr:type II toxin-antitoxin system HicA family toxin [Thomasclavelia cocleata]